MQCSYSNMEIAAHIDPSIPVQCPECESIRTIPRNKVYSDMFVFPAHNIPDNIRSKRCYKRINGIWQIVEKGE